jgi:hypothetical protein
MIKKVIVTLSIAIFGATGNAQTIFSRTYGAPGTFNEGASAASTNEKGFMLAGSTGGFGSINGDVLLIKTDSAGNQLWAKTYGTVYTEKAVELIKLSDGNYLIGSITNNAETGDYQVGLLKIDPDGNEINSQIIGTSSWDLIKGLAEGPDGSIVVSALSYAPPYPNGGHLIIKLDASGNELWRTFVSSADNQLAGGVIADNEGNVITSGGIYDEFYSNHAMVISKFSGNGDLVWQQTFNTSDNDYFTDVCLGSGNSYIVCGVSETVDSIVIGRIFKYDSTGVVLQSAETLTNLNYNFSDVSYWPADGSVIIGTTFNQIGDYQAILIKFAADFTYVCSSIGPETKESRIGNVLTTDSLLVFCGTSFAFTPGISSIFIKTAEALTCNNDANFQLSVNSISESKPLLFPNPNAGEFVIRCDPFYTEFKLYDLFGKEIKYKTRKIENGEVLIHVESIPNGIYMLRVFDETLKLAYTFRIHIQN